MGKWVRLDTRGAYPIFHVKFDSEIKYLKHQLGVKYRARALYRV